MIDQHDERVEGDLAEQEAPVVGEHVVQQEAYAARRAEALVDEADRGSAGRSRRCGSLMSPHQDGPTGPDIGPAASAPVASISSGSWGRARPAGPN